MKSGIFFDYHLLGTTVTKKAYQPAEEFDKTSSLSNQPLPCPSKTKVGSIWLVKSVQLISSNFRNLYWIN